MQEQELPGQRQRRVLPGSLDENDRALPAAWTQASALSRAGRAAAGHREVCGRAGLPGPQPSERLLPTTKWAQTAADPLEEPEFPGQPTLRLAYLQAGFAFQKNKVTDCSAEMVSWS